MCLPEAPGDFVRRYVAHVFACSYFNRAWLRCLVKTRNHQRRYWSLLTSVRTRHGVTQKEETQPTESIEPYMYWSG